MLQTRAKQQRVVPLVVITSQIGSRMENDQIVSERTIMYSRIENKEVSNAVQSMEPLSAADVELFRSNPKGFMTKYGIEQSPSEEDEEIVADQEPEPQGCA